MGERPRRVYVRHGTRMTPAQALGYQDRIDHLLRDSESIESQFGRPASLLVEIGFGMGQVLLDFAASNPDWNCMGVDVYRPGIGAVVRQIQSRRLSNLKIVEDHGLSALEQLPDASIDMIWVFFPDPWPKRRHFKRRLINEEFAAVVADKLRKDAAIYIATDWAPYAEAINTVMRGDPRLDGGGIDRPEWRPETKFERRGLELGHPVYDYRYARVA